MKKINYRTTVLLNDTTLQLGFRAKLPDDYYGQRLRVQAIFIQRSVERRFPMDVHIREEEAGPHIYADAQIELPFVFVNTPRHKVSLIFAIWLGMKEVILDEQPFPVNKELFTRNERAIHRNVVKFILGTLALPGLVAKSYLKEKDKKAALKEANAEVYQFSGYNYSPRQRNTDYFSLQYDRFVKTTKIRENNILFLSERLPEEGGNLMRVMKLFENDPSVEISRFIVDKTVDLLSRKELRECAALIAQAKVVILEDFYPQLHRLQLRSDTRVVQLWHACGAFKTFGLTRMGKPGGAPQSSLNHRNYDLSCVSSEAIRGIYAEAFGITTSKVKALGVPRTDILFDEAYKSMRKKELLAKYPQLNGRKVILFAPTFRGDGNRDAYYPQGAFDVNRFMEGMPEDSFCIVKHHPFVKQSIQIRDEFRNCILDLTGKDHINDLLLLTDLLITDYSSSIFEAAILKVPMLFYAFDKKEYIESRDFYCDYDSFAPGYIENDFEKMKDRVRMILQGEESAEDKRKISQRTVQFTRDFLSALDGHSSERIVEYIKKNYLKG